MRVVFYVLTKPLMLQNLLDALHENGVGGGTIFETKGMGTELARRDDFKISGVLRSFFKGTYLEHSNTLMFVLPAEKVPVVSRVIHEVIGDLQEPDTGILFSLPVDFVEGMKT